MDRIDDAYNGLMGEEFMRKTRERLHWICSKVVGERILDVGCSQGTLARLLAPLGKHVLGIDINKDAVSYAEGKLPGLDDASRGRLQFVAMNFMDFKSEEQFDTVVMGEILEHLPDPAAFVKKACTHLVKGGTFVATVPFGINDDPDHRQTFYWSWIKDIVAPLFDMADIEFFGKWIGVVGVKRERKAAAEKTVPLAVVKDLEKAFYAIERPLVNDNKNRGLKLKSQLHDLDEARKALDAKAVEAQTAIETEAAQKARADKAVADYAKLKTDLSSEIARHKDAIAKLSADKDAELAKQKASIAKLTADKAAADAAAAKQKTALEGEVAKQKTALAAEQAKFKDLNSKLAATRNELAAMKSEALELRVNLDADRRISSGQAEQISVLKAALQFAANRPQIETNDTRLLEYSQEVRELRNALESKRDEAVERAERLGHLSGQVESLKAEKSFLSSRIAELAEALDKKTAEAASAAEYAKLFEPENARLEDERKKLQEKVAELSAREKELEESLASATEESNSKTEAINRIAAERTEFERDNALLRQDCKEKDSQLAKLQHVSGDIVALEQKNRQCEETLAQEKAKVAELTATLAQTSKDAEEKAAALSNSIGELEAYAKLCETEIAKLTNDQEALGKAKDVQSRDIGALKEEKGSLEASLAAANAEKGALTSRVSELESSLAATKDAAEKNVAKVLNLTSDLAKANARADKAVADYYKLKSDLTARIAKLDDALAEANASADKAAGNYRKLKSDLTARIAEQDAALAKLTAEKAASESEANSEKERLSSRISELEATLVAAKAESEENDAKVVALTSDLEEATARADKAAGDYRKLKADLLSKIAKQGDELARLAAGKAAVESDAVKRDAELSNLVDSLRKERTKLLTAKQHAENIAQRESGKYDKLAKAKLGRLTLAYWHLKDGLKKKLTNTPDKNTHSRTGNLQKTGNRQKNDRKSVANSSAASKASPIWSLAPDEGLSAASFRILFPCGSGNNPGANPFVGTIMETLTSLGAQVFYGADRLFKKDERFNVVHFMWPDALFGWTHEAISPEIIAKLEDSIKRHKESGAIIAYTRHNVRPHVDDNPLLIQAYDIVERSADLIFHMGEYSMKEFLNKHPESSSKNVIVPHHTYARISRSVTRKEAREWFGLSEDDKVVLSFGVFRNEDERSLLFTALRGCNIKNLKVLAPRFSSCPPPWIIGHLNGGAVPEQILPMYFAAADVVFIQRRQILNSGNVPMAFYFGCACVGPDDGNVGEILKATGNPVFDPANPASAGEAIVKAFAAIDKYNRGAKNKKWADKNWNQELVVSQIMDAYRELAVKRNKVYRPRISIVVVGGKNEEEHRKTIDSIKSQTYPSESVEVVESARISEGLQKAGGELVAFLLSGDALSRRFLDCARVPFQNADVDCVALKWSLNGAFYLEDMANAFKYVDCNYITKAAFVEEGTLNAGPEHTYVSRMADKCRTVFWRTAYGCEDLLAMTGPQDLPGGYAIDHFNFSKGSRPDAKSERRQPKLSVIVPLHNNGWALYGRLFPSLRRADIFNDMEVVIVDAGSDDGHSPQIAARLAGKHDNVRLVKSDSKPGDLDAARDFGVAQAFAPYVLFADPEVEVDGHGLAVCLGRISNGGDLEVVIGNNEVCGVSHKVHDNFSVLNTFVEGTFATALGDGCTRVVSNGAEVYSKVGGSISGGANVLYRKNFILGHNLAHGGGTAFVEKAISASMKLEAVSIVVCRSFLEECDALAVKSADNGAVHGAELAKAKTVVAVAQKSALLTAMPSVEVPEDTWAEQRENEKRYFAKRERV